MALISLQDISLGFGGPLLLDKVNLQIEQGEYVGLLGRNGMGKSSLLKLINADYSSDSGLVSRQQNIQVSFLPQEVPQGLSGRVSDIVASGLFSSSNNHSSTDEHWQLQLAVEKVISRMQLDPQALFDTLSAGMKRRVMLARGLVISPDLLLLDEPTNHLDIDSIVWLEDFLVRWGGTCVFVTHDRVFLQRMATRIIELDRGRLFDWNCNYATFLQRKEAMLAAEQEQNILFDKKLAQEEQWIRQGIEARRTRNEGRVRALKRLRETRRERRELVSKVKLQIQEERRSGRLVIDAEKISFAYNDATVIKPFTTTILRGDKVGIIGPNGSGKTTLLQLMIGQIPPLSGEVRLGTNVEIAYFDQLRAQLNENQTVYDNVGEGRDTITINGRARSLAGYLEDFLFTSALLHSPISTLSGGERNRLLLARLFAKPANLLVLDEPTNDLDIETLELLEDLLLEFSGTLLLVSHDREFLNNLATSILALDDNGQVNEYIGGYDDWMRQSQVEQQEKVTGASRKIQPGLQTKPGTLVDEIPRKLSYKNQRLLDNQKQELADMPDRIQSLETEQHELTNTLASPEFYQQENTQITSSINRLKELEVELAQAYHRWEELEKIFEK